MVPVVTAHVGCVTLTVGATGGTAAVIVATVGVEIQVLSVVLRTVTLYDPTGTKLNVGEAW
jgi:hypothetical protein